MIGAEEKRPHRMRRTDRNLRYDHQTGEGVCLIRILPSSFSFQASAATRRLAVMNLALRGIEADFGPFDIRNSSFELAKN